MREKLWREWAMLAVAGVVAGLVVVPGGNVLSQGMEESRTLVIHGQAGEAPIARMQGKSYVELEALARLTHGSLSFSGTQVTLTLPGFGATATTIAGEKSEFSKEFLRAGIEEMAVIREWRIALVNAVQKGYAVTNDWITYYRSPAATDLRLASVAASTDSDRKAYQLLSNEFDNMKTLSDRFVDAHTAMNYTSLDALQSDPLDQKILNCARSLAAMAASGQFVDDGSCH